MWDYISTQKSSRSLSGRPPAVVPRALGGVSDHFGVADDLGMGHAYYNGDKRHRHHNGVSHPSTAKGL